MADVFRCRSCGREFTPEGTLFPAEQDYPLCPRCESLYTQGATPPAPRSSATDPEITRTIPPISPSEEGATAAVSGEVDLTRGVDLPPASVIEWPTLPGYTVVDLLGRGGMGVVFLAEQEKANRRRVAVKMILARRGIDDDYIRRFDAEVRAVSSLEHPNIIRVYEVGDADGRRFFSMEYCPGGTLADRLRQGPMLPRVAAEAIVTLARAMVVVHARGIVHRDLKPLNVLYDAAGELKVSDFGLVKDIEAADGATVTGSITGTLGYMSPEQAAGQGNTASPETDVYALGAILYAALTGRVPFAGSSTSDTLLQIRHDDPVSVRRLVPNTPRDLETICMKCLQKDRVRRYRTAADLALDLQRFLDGRPITARPVSVVERVWKAAKRRPAAALLIATLATSGVGAAVGAVLLFLANQREQAARLLADENARKADAAARRARQFSAFVLNGLGETDPFTRYFPLHIPAAADPGRPDRGVTASPEFLRRMKATADRDLNAYPHERAKVMLVIGNAMRTYSQFADADAALTAAQEAFDAADETTAEDRFRTRFSRASYRHDIGELESAFDEFTALLADPDSPLSEVEVANTRFRVAWLCADRIPLPGHVNSPSRGVLAERGLAEVRMAQEVFRRVGGPTDARVIICELLVRLSDRGKDNLGLASAIMQATMLPRSDAILKAYLLYAEAEAHRVSQNFPEAVRKLLDMDRMIADEFGTRSHFRALALGALAGVESQAYYHEQDPKRKAEYARDGERHTLDALQLGREFAPRHPRIAEGCVKLAAEYMKMKRYPEAAKLLAEAKEVARYHPNDLKGMNPQIDQMIAAIPRGP